MKATTKKTFQQDVIESQKIILLDVWAPWCAPCRGMEPVIHGIDEEISDWVDIVKLDASTEMDLAQQLGVSGLPTFLVYKKGQIVDSTTGATSKDNIMKMLNKARA